MVRHSEGGPPLCFAAREVPWEKPQPFLSPNAVFEISSAHEADSKHPGTQL